MFLSMLWLKALHIVAVISWMAGMLYLQRDNEWSNKMGGLAAAMLLGYLIPQQFLHRFAKS